MPSDIPDTTPVAEPIDPSAGLLLLHIPPADASAKVVVEPVHVPITPVIGSMVFTVTTVVARHPVPVE